MAIFSFPYHTVKTKYAPSGFRVSFGGNYTFTAAPDAPTPRIFTLSFPDGAMKYFLNEADEIDPTIEPERNMQAMDDFYREHETWKSFTYNHPVYGALNVKFSKELEIPEGIKGGDGAVEGFSLEMTEDV